MVRLRGLEPLTYRFGICRSIQLSYRRMNHYPPDAQGPSLRPSTALKLHSRFSHPRDEWGERRDLNPQPPDPQSGALTN